MITHAAAVACTLAAFLAGIGVATAAVIPAIRHRARRAVQAAWRPEGQHRRRGAD